MLLASPTLAELGRWLVSLTLAQGWQAASLTLPNMKAMRRRAPLGADSGRCAAVAVAKYEWRAAPGYVRHAVPG